MNIRYYRGDDHEIRFRFKDFTRKLDNIFFIVRDLDKSVKIKKQLGDGIELVDGWYYVKLKPEDTNTLSYTRKMIYDIKIVIEGSTYTVRRGNFKIE